MQDDVIGTIVVLVIIGCYCAKAFGHRWVSSSMWMRELFDAALSGGLHVGLLFLLQGSRDHGEAKMIVIAFLVFACVAGPVVFIVPHYLQHRESAGDIRVRAASIFDDPASSFVFRVIPVGSAQVLLLVMIIVRLVRMRIHLHGTYLAYYALGVVMNFSYLRMRLNVQGNRSGLVWSLYFLHPHKVFHPTKETTKSIDADANATDAELANLIEAKTDDTGNIHPFSLDPFPNYEVIGRFTFAYIINIVAVTVIFLFLPLSLSDSVNNMEFVLHSVAILFLDQLDDLDSLRAYVLKDPAPSVATTRKMTSSLSV